MLSKKTPGRSTAVLILFGGFLAIFVRCSIDQGIDPQVTVPTIRGRVIFQGDRPANTEWVVVVASRDFPPTDVVELAQSQSNFLSLDSDTSDYEIILPAFGSYAAIGAVWKGAGEPLALSDVLGIHGAAIAGGLSLPDTVTVTPADPVASGIDIEADFLRVNRGAVIRGRINYQGAWPENTELMAIAGYEQRPLSILEFITDLVVINIGLPLEVDSFDYKLAVPPGTYGYLVVLWKARGTSFIEFEELGFHETERGSGIPGLVTVAQDDTVRGVDIFVDFSQAPANQ